MPLSTDPETLRVPAFMRKRSLAKRAKKPLMLTALDRKQAGLPPEGIAPKVKRVHRPSHTAQIRRPTVASEFKVHQEDLFDSPVMGNLWQTASTQSVAQEENPTPRTARSVRVSPPARPTKPRLTRVSSKKTTPPRIHETQNQKIGKVTHYYEKIQVAVFSLTDTLCVGDCIKYLTEDGLYEQIVESMEIDRNPVFKAARGDEIGIKLQKKPIVDGAVIKS